MGGFAAFSKSARKGWRGRGGRLRRFGMKGFDEPVEQADQFSLLLFIFLGRFRFLRRPAVIRPRALQNRLGRAVEFGFQLASRRFPDEIGDLLEFLAVQGRPGRPVFARFDPVEGAVVPVRFLQLAVVAALQGLGLLFLLFGAALVLFAVTGIRDHLYARDPRQERQNSLGLFLQARADDARILGLMHRLQPVTLGEVTGDQLDALPVEFGAAGGLTFLQGREPNLNLGRLFLLLILFFRDLFFALDPLLFRPCLRGFHVGQLVERVAGEAVFQFL